MGGAKETNEDRVAATDLQELGFIAGVFDGHRGSQCSDYVSSHIPKAVLATYRDQVKRAGNLVKLSHAQEAGIISVSICKAFEAVDQAFLAKKGLVGGST